MIWEPLLDVSEESMTALVQACEPGSILYRVTQRIIAGLGSGPEGILSAFQSVVDDVDVMVSGFASTID